MQRNKLSKGFSKLYFQKFVIFFQIININPILKENKGGHLGNSLLKLINIFQQSQHEGILNDTNLAARHSKSGKHRDISKTLASDEQ